MNQLNLKVSTSSNYKKINNNIVDFLKKGFDFISNRNDFDNYFNKFTTLSKINWINFNSKPIGFYCMLINQFIYNNKIINAGKPELNLVSGDFIKSCINKKINYDSVNPMKLLHKTVMNQAEGLKLKFLFTWPNAIAQPTYSKNGYYYKDIKISTFTKILDYKFTTKKTSNLIIILILKIFNFIFKIKNPFLKKIELEEVKSIPINDFNIEINWNEYCNKNNYKLYPYKTNEIINKRYNEDKFKKYLIKFRNQYIGFVILKNKTDRTKINYIWIVDYFIPDKFLYSLLNSIHSDKHDAIQCRFYSTSHKKINNFKMYFIGFIIKTEQKKKLNYYLLDVQLEKIFNEKIKIDDSLTDFGM